MTEPLCAPSDPSQEYGVKESANVGTPIKEAPNLANTQSRPRLPDWTDLKATLLRAIEKDNLTVLRRLQSKGRFT